MPTHDDPRNDPETGAARDALEAFNAEGVIDDPGPPDDPEDKVDSPASDADAPAPPG